MWYFSTDRGRPRPPRYGRFDPANPNFHPDEFQLIDRYKDVGSWQVNRRYGPIKEHESMLGRFVGNVAYTVKGEDQSDVRIEREAMDYQSSLGRAWGSMFTFEREHKLNAGQEIVKRSRNAFEILRHIGVQNQRTGKLAPEFIEALQKIRSAKGFLAKNHQAAKGARFERIFELKKVEKSGTLKGENFAKSARSVVRAIQGAFFIKEAIDILVDEIEKSGGTYLNFNGARFGSRLFIHGSVGTVKNITTGVVTATLGMAGTRGRIASIYINSMVLSFIDEWVEKLELEKEFAELFGGLGERAGDAAWELTQMAVRDSRDVFQSIKRAQGRWGTYLTGYVGYSETLTPEEQAVFDRSYQNLSGVSQGIYATLLGISGQDDMMSKSEKKIWSRLSPFYNVYDRTLDRFAGGVAWATHHVPAVMYHEAIRDKERLEKNISVMLEGWALGTEGMSEKDRQYFEEYTKKNKFTEEVSEKLSDWAIDQWAEMNAWSHKAKTEVKEALKEKKDAYQYGGVLVQEGLGRLKNYTNETLDILGRNGVDPKQAKVKVWKIGERAMQKLFGWF